MLADSIIVCDWFYHLNVVLFFSISKSWFKNNEIIIITICFKINSLSKCWHLASCQVNSSFNLTCSIAEFEHIWIILSSVIFQSTYNRNGVKVLTIKICILFQLFCNLMDSHWKYRLVIDRFVLFLGGVHNR
jgi:hypothetical protein